MARPMCDDWACPAMVSCARHFGRSLAYWAMSEEPRRFEKGERRLGQDSCPDYERDKVRPWMVEALTPPPLTPTGAWRMPLFVDVTNFAEAP